MTGFYLSDPPIDIFKNINKVKSCPTKTIQLYEILEKRQ